MATYSIPGQNLNLNLPEEGQIFRSMGTQLGENNPVYKRVGNQIISFDAGSVAPGTNASTLYENTFGPGAYMGLSQYNLADVTTAINELGGKFTGTSDINSFNPNGAVTPGLSYTKTVSPNNPNGAVITASNGQIVSQSPSLADVQAGKTGATQVNPTVAPNNGGQQTAPPLPQAPVGTQANAGSLSLGQAGTPTTPAAPVANLNPPSTILQPGSADVANVGKLQDYLVSLGLMKPEDLLNGGKGIYGPKTTAAVAALQSALGVDNSTGVGYFGPKTIAALAGKALPNNGGNQAGDSSAAQTGTPTSTNTENGKTVAQNVQDVYTELYKASGLSDIKTHYEDTLKQQENLTNEMNGKIADVRNNPWMSQSEADRNVKNIQDRYSVKLDTLSHFATLYETIYKDGLDEIQFRTGLAEHDIQRAYDAAQKRQDALDKLAQSDIHSETVNGRVVLVDYKTRKIVADLGASRVAGGTSTPSGYNGEFAATIANAARQGSTDKLRAQTKADLENFIANKDYASAYTAIIDATQRGLMGPSKTDFQQRNIQLETTQSLKNALQALADSGYDTNLLTGTADKIQTKLGVLQTDPKYAAVANQVNLAFQDYRQKMTGAAFGQKESSEYASVLPSASNTLALNLAKIDGLNAYLNSVSDGYIRSIVGQGGIEIKAYANGATPSSSTGGGATSGGNSYTITQTP